MTIFNFDCLSRQAKISYNALYNVVFPYAKCNSECSFTVPLCLSSDNKVSLTEKNFIFFDSVLKELNLYGWYSIVKNEGRALDDVKGDFFTVSITVSNKKIEPPKGLKLSLFDFSGVDVFKLLKRDGKAEKTKTIENKKEKSEVEKKSKDLKEKVEQLEKEIAKKDEQLNKKAIDEFNDDALISIANCIEFLVKKHCPIPSDYDFKAFECDLFKVIECKWDLKAIEK